MLNMDVSRHQQTKFVLLMLIFITSLNDSIGTTVSVGKYSVEKNRRVIPTITPVESELAKSIIVCVRRFHGRDDACLADYNPETQTCNIFTSGCCPGNGNDETQTGFSLFRRDLEGKMKFRRIQNMLQLFDYLCYLFCKLLLLSIS